jgi:prevent-host-death family protein
MEYVSSGEMRRKFAEILEEVILHPVVVRKHKRDVAVIMSAKKFAEMQSLEDAILGKMAQKAHQQGDYLSEEESANLIDKILNAED